MKTQGSYKFFTRSVLANGTVHRQMKIEADPSKPQLRSGTNVCTLGPGGRDSGDREGSFGPFTAMPNASGFGTLAYYRDKCTDAIMIWLTYTNTSWELKGKIDGIPPYGVPPHSCVNDDANPAVTCWGCGNDYDCTETIIVIPYSDAVLCNPAATAPATTTSCHRPGEACGASQGCCSNNACVDNVCKLTCGLAGTACTSNSNCCSNSCVSGACESTVGESGGGGGGNPPRPPFRRDA